MISYGPMKDQAFPSWHMGARKIEGSSIDFKTNITSEDKSIFNDILSGKEENGTKVPGLLKKFF